MSIIELTCAHCGRRFNKEAGQANRQRRLVGPHVQFYCTRRCHSTSRKLHKPKAQRVAEKAAYDREYRSKNRDNLKVKKHEYFRKTYDPEMAAKRRKQIREWHHAYSAEYRSRPEWKTHKSAYDRRRRASEFGPFAECHTILVDLMKEIRRQPWYQRAKERGYYDNNRTTNQRKRNESVSRW